MTNTTNRTRAQKIYFASDFHLGIPDRETSLIREKRLVDWLEHVRKDAREIYLMGDVFDFWFEYKTVVPKGYVRLLGQLARITDAGIPVHLFRGNHDIWAFDYLEKEAGLVLHRKPVRMERDGKTFYLAHGDGLGPGDSGYKFLKRVFECRFCQWLFRWLHPDLGARMGLFFSRRSRCSNMAREGKNEGSLKDPENEMLYRYTQDLIGKNITADYFIFGHRHRPLQVNIGKGCAMVILGDWITHFTYAVFDGKELHLKKHP